ncbi:hypothetical protein V5O48_006711, partial [Marasmius crinis-equi]
RLRREEEHRIKLKRYKSLQLMQVSQSIWSRKREGREEEGRKEDSEEEEEDSEEERPRSIISAGQGSDPPASRSTSPVGQESKPAASSLKVDANQVPEIIDVDDQVGLCDRPLAGLHFDPSEQPWFRTRKLPPFQDSGAMRRLIASIILPHKGDWTFDPDLVTRLDNPMEMTSDNDITFGALALQHFLHGKNTAVFGTNLFDVESTAGVYKHAKLQEFWDKDAWLLPGHINGNHWALAIVQPEKSRVLFFDSLAMRTELNQWVKTIKTKIQELVSGAVQRQKKLKYDTLHCLDKWTFHQLLPERIQTNGVDCGVWVLWAASAVLQGYDYAPLDEKDIKDFRKFVADLLRTFPAVEIAMETDTEDGFEILDDNAPPKTVS